MHYCGNPKCDRYMKPLKDTPCPSCGSTQVYVEHAEPVECWSCGTDNPPKYDNCWDCGVSL
jgi:ribosomal protein S27AE